MEEFCAKEIIIRTRNLGGKNCHHSKGLIIFHKEDVVKTMWNVTAKLVQEKYLEDFGITIDPFND